MIRIAPVDETEQVGRDAQTHRCDFKTCGHILEKFRRNQRLHRRQQLVGIGDRVFRLPFVVGKRRLVDVAVGGNVCPKPITPQSAMDQRSGINRWPKRVRNRRIGRKGKRRRTFLLVLHKTPSGKTAQSGRCRVVWLRNQLSQTANIRFVTNICKKPHDKTQHRDRVCVVSIVRSTSFGVAFPCRKLSCVDGWASDGIFVASRPRVCCKVFASLVTSSVMRKKRRARANSIVPHQVHWRHRR